MSYELESCGAGDLPAPLFSSHDPGGLAMDFQVHDETYFVDLDDERREWRVFLTTPTGATPVPVYVDEEESFEDGVILVEDKKRQNIVN